MYCALHSGIQYPVQCALLYTAHFGSTGHPMNIYGQSMHTEMAVTLQNKEYDKDTHLRPLKMSTEVLRPMLWWFKKDVFFI